MVTKASNALVRQTNLWDALFVVRLSLSSVLWKDLLLEGSGWGGGGSAEPFSAEYAVHTSARGAADVNSSGRHQRGSQALLGPRRGAVRPEAGASCCSAEDTTATCCHTASLSRGAQRVTPSQHHALPAREGPQGSSGTTFLGKSVV